ncbi:response regulator [Methylobacterium nigriterrae]|uniref:response regulator n=1 Tax=Methylobacterium nigriterrae TaxID=3127512 RepID=UPI003013C5B9
MAPRSQDSPTAVVLVVEDETLVRMIATDILTEAGYRVLEARDADEALVLLGARNDIDLVFSDCEMPGAVDGVGLAHLVHERRPDLPLLLTSGRMRLAPVDLPPGARFLEKPYRPSVLIDKVETCLATGAVTMEGAPVLPQGMTGQPAIIEGGQIAAAPTPEPDKT